MIPSTLKAAFIGALSLTSAMAEGTVDAARDDLKKAVSELDSTQKEYGALRNNLYKEINRLDDEALSLTKELRALEKEESQRATNLKILDRELDKSKTDVKYAIDLLNQYSKALVTRLHPAEGQLYNETVQKIDQKALTLTEDPKAELIERCQVLKIGLDRLGSIIGGHRFNGRALKNGSQATDGTLLLAGPSVFFASNDKTFEGVATYAATGTPYPSVLALKDTNGIISQTLANSSGTLPMDSTMGKALEEKNDQVESGHSKTMEHLSLFSDIAKNMMFDGWIAIGVCFVMIALGWSVAARKMFYLNSIKKGTDLFLAQWDKLSSDLTSIDHADGESVKSLGGNADPKVQKLVQRSPLYHIYHIGSEEIRHRLTSDENGVPTTTLSSRSVQAIRASLDAGLVRENHKLTDGLVYLTISIAGGPYVGLLGTVVGVMITFAIISKQGQVDVNSIAPGIASALLATVAGLVVAIPALFIYSYLNGRIKNMVAEMQVFIDEFVAKVAEFYPDTEAASTTPSPEH